MIAIDGRALLEDRPGGIPFATDQLLRAMEEAGERATVVLSTRQQGAVQMALPTVWIRRSNRFQLVRHAIGMGEPFDAMVFRATGIWPDVVFAPALQPLRLTRAALALTVHDCSFLRFPQWMRLKDRLWHALLRPRQLIWSATRIICPSEFTRHELVYLFPQLSSRITVIPWGAAVGRGFASTGEAKLRVVAIGVSHRRKNPELLLRLKHFLAAFDPPHELVMIDPHDPVTEQEKWRILSGARALLYPSFCEGFGFPPLEAFAAGVPVVASCAGAIPEVLADAAILVNPYAPEQWQQALRAVLTDEPLREQLIARGRQRAQQFSWQRCATDILTVLTSTARSNSVNK